MALPMFMATDCQMCNDRRVEQNGRLIPTCADCGKTIPKRFEDIHYLMNEDHGFQSFTWDHEHMMNLDGVGLAKGPGYRELCYECMKIDYLKRYPPSA